MRTDPRLAVGFDSGTSTCNPFRLCNGPKSWGDDTHQLERIAMLFKRKPSNQPVRPGTRYHRTHDASNLVETVEVLDVRRDHRGIPHVRFEIKFGWPRPLGVAAQSRLLCLDEFTNRYSPIRS